MGSRGVIIAGYNIKPDIAITIDLDFATDVPDCSSSKYGKIELGGGVPVEMCDLRDVDAVIRLITQFCIQKEF